MVILSGEGLEAKEGRLKFLQSGETGWIRYYLDEDTLEKWVKEYPNSSYHGGGNPVLKKIDKFPWEKVNRLK